MVRRPRAVPVHDIGDGGVAGPGRRGDRPFVGRDEGIDVAHPFVVEKGAVMVDPVPETALAAIAEPEPLRDSHERIQARRVHPVAADVEGLSRDEIHRVGAPADAM